MLASGFLDDDMGVDVDVGADICADVDGGGGLHGGPLRPDAVI